MRKKTKDITDVHMTKSELMEAYEKYKDSDTLAVNLHIHMPDDSIEIIFNSEGHNKIKYVDETYDENLIHKNCKDIYIIDVDFFADKLLEFGFDSALRILYRGKRLARHGWNGKSMFIYYVPKFSYKPKTKAALKHCMNKDGMVPYGAYIAIKTADGTVVPWVASQTDILARDWYVVDDEGM